MRTGQKLWTRDELILALNLYYKLPFGRLHAKNPEVVQLSSLLDRTPGSVAFKLVNFASFDPSLQARNIQGAANTSKLDRKIWDEFYTNLDSLVFESEERLAELNHTSVVALNSISEWDLPREGKERERLIKVRVNQAFFRKSVLASYNYRCCITGLDQKELLVAGHIMPWGRDEINRLNPRNGILINALHDKAFEAGLLSILPNYTIAISSILLEKNEHSAEELFKQFHGREIVIPAKFRPDPEFLRHHYETRFIR